VVRPTIEHVIEDLTAALDEPSSVFEQHLHRWLAEPTPFGLQAVRPARKFVAEPLEAHGRPGAVEIPLEPLGRVLEAGATHLEDACAAWKEQSRQAARQARALGAFARSRPARLLDRPDEEVGAAAAASRAARPAVLTEVSEWAVDEVMVGFGVSSRTAGALLAESVTLVEEFPATLDALEAGLIDRGQARMLTEELAPLPPDLRVGVEAELLAGAEGRTLGQLRAAAQRAVLRADATAAARRLAAAIRRRAVRSWAGEHGMGTLAADMTLPALAACKAKLRALAEACATPGDQRTLDQRMLDCLVDLILRGTTTELPPVQVQLTVVATAATLAGGEEPGEVNGQPISAVEVRELAYALALLPRPVERATLEAEVGPIDEVALSEAEPSPSQADLANAEGPAVEAAEPETPSGPSSAALKIAAAGLPELLSLRSTTGTALAELPKIAVVDEISGQLLALTDAAGIRCATTAGTGLGPPADSPGYRPSNPLDRFVRARDRRCRFPGCRAAAIRCDLDHNRPYPAGATSAGNLCCLCRHHHRLSHQAPGWTMTRLPDGGLQWTSPSGHTVTTHPPAFGTDDHPPPPTRAPSGLDHLRRDPLPPDPLDPAPF